MLVRARKLIASRESKGENSCERLFDGVVNASARGQSTLRGNLCSNQFADRHSLSFPSFASFSLLTVAARIVFLVSRLSHLSAPSLDSFVTLGSSLLRSEQLQLFLIAEDYKSIQIQSI